MTRRCVPMIHVPDVRATVDWYLTIGFDVTDTYSDAAGGLSFAIMSFGDSQVMFNNGGHSGAEHRDVDLYLYTTRVDEIFASLRERVEVIQEPHDRFYGMREVIVRDLNGFCITFGEPTAGEALLESVREGNFDAVRDHLNRDDLTRDWLSVALADAVTREQIAIVELLKSAGAIAPPTLSADLLSKYCGTYRSDENSMVTISALGADLWAFPDESDPARLVPIDSKTFRPLQLPHASVEFDSGADGRMTLSFTQGERRMLFSYVG